MRGNIIRRVAAAAALPAVIAITRMVINQPKPAKIGDIRAFRFSHAEGNEKNAGVVYSLERLNGGRPENGGIV